MTDEYYLITKGLEDCEYEIKRSHRDWCIENYNKLLEEIKNDDTNIPFQKSSMTLMNDMRSWDISIIIFNNEIELIKCKKLVYIEMNLVYTSIQNPKTARVSYPKIQDKFDTQCCKVRRLFRKQLSLRINECCDEDETVINDLYKSYLDKCNKLKEQQKEMELICRRGEYFADQRTLLHLHKID